MVFVLEVKFEGTDTWNGGTECQLIAKRQEIGTVSPLPSFGGKEDYCVPEEIFVARFMHEYSVLAIRIELHAGA